jgi:hypothetical protein
MEAFEKAGILVGKGKYHQVKLVVSEINVDKCSVCPDS